MASPIAEYKERLSGIRQLVKLRKSYDGNLPGIPKHSKRKLAAEIDSACLLLPVAYFEEYIYSVVLYFITCLCKYRPRINWEDLPETLREAVVYDSLKTISKWPKGETIIATESIMFPLYRHLASPVNSPDSYTIPPEILKPNEWNPDSKMVFQLMKRIGVVDIFKDIAILLPGKYPIGMGSIYSNDQSIRRKIDDIVNTRHRIAHGSRSISKSLVEIEEQIDFLEKFSAILFEVIEKHKRMLASRRR